MLDINENILFDAVQKENGALFCLIQLHFILWLIESYACTCTRHIYCCGHWPLTVAMITLAQDTALERDLEFWISLCCTFEVSEQLSSVIQILQYLMSLPQDKEDGGTQHPFT